jgi:uncharacterized protein with ATP-grasp and redox domains
MWRVCPESIKREDPYKAVKKRIIEPQAMRLLVRGSRALAVDIDRDSSVACLKGKLALVDGQKIFS